MSTLTIFDFDRTIFNTDEFVEAVLQNFAAKGLLNNEDKEQALSRYYGSEESMSIFDLLAPHGYAEEHVVRVVAGLGQTFVYPDVDMQEVNSNESMVITTASSKTLQEAKLRIAGVTCSSTVLDSNKGEYILNNCVAEEDGLVFKPYSAKKKLKTIRIIDDRESAIRGLFDKPRFEVFLLQRPQQKYLVTESNITAKNVTIITSIRSFNA